MKQESARNPNMKVDILAAINPILLTHPSVCIPGFGGFVTEYRSAVIDHVQGMLFPPSKGVRFLRRLNQNDGILHAYLKEKYQFSDIEIEESLKDFNAAMDAALKKKEIIVFPYIGRLYMDYEGQLQFLQHSNNLNADVYGLPNVQFYPIYRNKEDRQALAPKKEAKVLPLKKENNPVIERTMPFMAPAMIGMAMVALIATIYIFTKEKVEDGGILKVPVVDTRINARPSSEESTAEFEEYTDLDDGTRIEEEITEEIPPTIINGQSVDEDGVYDNSIDTEAITRAPNQKEAIIIIGAYSKKSGVRKRIQQIYELGYDAYQDKKNGLTRVGAQFIYENDREMRNVLQLMKRRFDDSSYLLIDEG